MVSGPQFGEQEFADHSRQHVIHIIYDASFIQDHASTVNVKHINYIYLFHNDAAIKKDQVEIASTPQVEEHGIRLFIHGAMRPP